MAGMRPPSPPLPPDPFITYGASKARPVEKASTAAGVGAAQDLSQIDEPDRVHAAVNNVVDRSYGTDIVDPNTIQHITEQVIQKLQAANLIGTSVPLAAVPSLPQHVATQFPPSPVLSCPDTTTQYAAPTLHNLPEDPREHSVRCMSPDTIAPESERRFTIPNLDALKTDNGDNGGDVTRPQYATPKGRSRRNTTSGATSPPHPISVPPRRESEVASTTAQRPNAHKANIATDPRKPSQSQSTVFPPDPEETLLEKIWQPLFDNGNPTVRASQFLRGLALHLIEDYEPKQSLVISPAKMLRFLTQTKVSDEVYPWTMIFRDTMSNTSLSTMYTRLHCQHHLVQSQNDEFPRVPSLTPAGFEQFMIWLIQAYPNKEYERLSQAVMNMPISNADDRSERFPKELPRSILPAEGNFIAAQRFLSCVGHEPSIAQARNEPRDFAPPSPRQKSRADVLPKHSFNERERQPYCQSSKASSVAVSDEPAEAPLLERQRKPYVAKEGGGKIYTDGVDLARGPPTSSATHSANDTRQAPEPYRSEPQQSRNDPRLRRTSSTKGPSRDLHSSSTGQQPVSNPTRSHRMSVDQGDVPSYTAERSNPKPRRSSQVPRNGQGRAGEPFNDSRNDRPPQAPFGSSLYHTRSAGGARDYYPSDSKPDESARRRYSNRDPSRPYPTSTLYDDDLDAIRAKPAPRSVPGVNNYDNGTSAYSASSFGGPPPPPLHGGSFSCAGAAGVAIPDTRRRSTYDDFNSGSRPAGGTDGWGSYAAAQSERPSAYFPAPPLPQPPHQHYYGPSGGY